MTGFDKVILWTGVTVVIGSMILICFLFNSSFEDFVRLKKECMDDGHPEYYCNSLINGCHK
jgi:hypothetical protein